MTKMQGCPIDRRKLHRLHRKTREAIRKAEDRINAKIVAKMQELKRNEAFLRRIDAELLEVRDEKSAQEYIRSAPKRAEEETALVEGTLNIRGRTSIRAGSSGQGRGRNGLASFKRERKYIE